MIVGNIKGLSKLSLLVLLFTSALFGAVLSYLWTEGYYIETGHKVPEDVITITITNVTFPVANSTFFNVTVLNPSFSKADAYITGIALIATINGVETIDPIQADTVVPAIPYLLSKGETETFSCQKNWGHLAGDQINVAVILESDSGSIFTSVTSEVTLEIIRADFQVATSIRQFNVTIRNSIDSLTPLNVSEIWFDTSKIPTQNVTIPDEPISLPYQLLPGENQTFTLFWNLWETGALGFAHNITVNTLQGYSAGIKTQVLPPEITLAVDEPIFAMPYTDHFNVSISNPLIPGAYSVDISRITVTVGSQTFTNITIAPDIDVAIPPGTTRTLQCLWSWDGFKGQNATLKVHTSQGFHTSEDIQIQAAFGIPIAVFYYIPKTPSTSELITFNASESLDTYGTIDTYFWEFGDSTNSTGRLTTHSYTDHGNYTVVLTITDNDGLTDTTSTNITVLNQLPAPSFTESTTSLFTGETVYFNASSSHDHDGSILSYSWDFGDSTNSTGVFVNHTYSDDGNFMVVLTVTDDDGAWNSTSQLMTVLNRSPSAYFTTSATTVFVNETITFNASTSYDPDGSIVDYRWSFDDGSNATGLTVDHAYTTEGTYLVILNVTDDDGATAQANVTITVVQPAPATTAVTTDRDSAALTESSRLSILLHPVIRANPQKT